MTTPFEAIYSDSAATVVGDLTVVLNPQLAIATIEGVAQVSAVHCTMPDGSPMPGGCFPYAPVVTPDNLASIYTGTTARFLAFVDGSAPAGAPTSRFVRDQIDAGRAVVVTTLPGHLVVWSVSSPMEMQGATARYIGAPDGWLKRWTGVDPPPAWQGSSSAGMGGGSSKGLLIGLGVAAVLTAAYFALRD